MKRVFLMLFVLASIISCKEKEVRVEKAEVPFTWDNANVYFMLTDRFNNGDTSNDVNFGRDKETAVLRGFMGGDLKGVTQKINEGYFTDLGINAIWMTPIVEQIHEGTDENTGFTYGFHGYWTKDWTTLDPNFGTEKDLKTLVETAHKNGIRILLDAVINHIGPVTETDTVWPEEWVRTEPKCEFQSYETTVTCTLVKNLPDIKTESDQEVTLPPQLVSKWKEEGRYEKEVDELDAFFERTKYPKAPRFYIMKWLTDYITDYGIDGYRVDTVKHTEEYVWQEFRTQCDYAFERWKQDNQEVVLDDNGFYLVGEVYNYNISHGRAYDFGDKKADYFDKAFDALINFELKYNAAEQDYETMFNRYSTILNSDKGIGTLNYFTSHDDGQPFDKDRTKPFESATKLLLSPGASQVYYGDESARDLTIEGANGDATLRSFMNWEDIKNNVETKNILEHWQKLGQFRANHPSVGAGVHQMITKAPYTFSRNYKDGDYTDKVVVGLDLAKGSKEISVGDVFSNDTNIRDAYSGIKGEVKDGKVLIDTPYDIVLLEKI